MPSFSKFFIVIALNILYLSILKLTFTEFLPWAEYCHSFNKYFLIACYEPGIGLSGVVSTVRGREEVDPNTFENMSETFEAYFPLRNHKGIKNNEL